MFGRPRGFFDVVEERILGLHELAKGELVVSAGVVQCSDGGDGVKGENVVGVGDAKGVIIL